MPDSKYTGNPGGSGNPPGKHSRSYLSSKGDKGHFVTKKSYQGSMAVNRSNTAPNVGNQPKQNTTSALGMRTKALP